MRTKALILTAAVGAIGVATSVAQVYSVNAVGYVNQNIPNGLSLIANPFFNQNNTLDALLNPNNMPGAGVGVVVYRLLANGTFYVSTVDPLSGGVWLDPNGNPNGSTESIIFGDGIFLRNDSGTSFTVTWVGEVAQAAASNGSVPIGLSIKSSKVPQSGLIQSQLGFPASAGDVLSKWDSASIPQRFVQFTQDPLGNGTPAEWQDANGNPGNEPTIGVAESFFMLKVDSQPWNRNFTVN